MKNLAKKLTVSSALVMGVLAGQSAQALDLGTIINTATQVGAATGTTGTATGGLGGILNTAAQVGAATGTTGSTGGLGGILNAAGQASSISKGVEALSTASQALTLSDADVAAYSAQIAAQTDAKNQIAPATSAYGKRLAKIVKGYERTGGLKLNFKVYQVKDVNAFALGDGSVRVNSGLLDLMTDDEVRFVLGHEIGHVVLGHSKAHLKAELASSAVFNGAAAAGGRVGQLAGSQYAALADQFLKAQYSQVQETAADNYGLSLLKAKKLNQQAAATALDKLATLGGSGGLLADHPSAQARAANIRRQITSK